MKLRGFVRSRDKLKTMYLHYHNGHGHKLWQNIDLSSVTFTHKVTLPQKHVVL